VRTAIDRAARTIADTLLGPRKIKELLLCSNKK
jgi:hypothetical protein